MQSDLELVTFATFYRNIRICWINLQAVIVLEERTFEYKL